MCQKRTKKIKKGSQMSRGREARRHERLNWGATADSDDSNPSPPFAMPLPNKMAQNRVILELAWKTVVLMHKNRLIRQRIVALQKETSEFLANILSNPENRRRYMEQVRLYGLAQQAQHQNNNEANASVKTEPNM